MTSAVLIRDILIITIWALAVSSAVIGLIHLVTWWVIRAQVSQTDVGTALNRRELTLGVKALCRTFFDSLLVAAVTFGVDFDDDMDLLSPFFVALTLAALAANYYGIRYVAALRREGWGQPTSVTSFSAGVADTIDQTATDVSEVKADVKDLKKHAAAAHVRADAADVRADAADVRADAAEARAETDRGNGP